MRLEADAMRACRRAGLRVPEVLLDDDGALLGTAGPRHARGAGRDARPRILATTSSPLRGRCSSAQLGAFLAGLHAIDPAEVPGAGRDRRARRATGRATTNVADRSPTFEKAYAWLQANRPARAGDARSSTATCAWATSSSTATGSRAVIDWELVHVGDPLEDLGVAVREGVAVRRAARGRRRRHRSTSWSTRTRRAGGQPVDRDALPLVARAEDAAVGHRLHGPGVRSTSPARCGRTSWPPSADASPSRSGTSSSCSRPRSGRRHGPSRPPPSVARRRRAARPPDGARDARRRARLPHRGRDAGHDRPAVVPRPGRREHARHRRARAGAGHVRQAATTGRRWRWRSATSWPSPTRSTLDGAFRRSRTGLQRRPPPSARGPSLRRPTPGRYSLGRGRSPGTAR